MEDKITPLLNSPKNNGVTTHPGKLFYKNLSTIRKEFLSGLDKKSPLLSERKKWGGWIPNPPIIRKEFSSEVYETILAFCNVSERVSPHMVWTSGKLPKVQANVCYSSTGIEGAGHTPCDHKMIGFWGKSPDVLGFRCLQYTFQVRKVYPGHLKSELWDLPATLPGGSGVSII